MDIVIALRTAAYVGGIVVLGCLVASCATRFADEKSISSTEVAEARGVAECAVNDQYASLAAELDQKMQSVLTASRLTVIDAQLKAKLGTPIAQGDPVVRKANGYTEVYVPYRFQHGSRDVKVVFNSDGMVAGLFFVKHVKV